MRAIRRLIIAAVALAVGFGGLPAAIAYPEKPIRLIVSFPPGGSADAIARIVQPGVEKELGQSLIVENRPGAGGTIALDQIAKAPPDGYLIGVGGAGALVASVGQALPYDPRKDLAHVTVLATSPFILAAATSFSGKSLRDVIAMAKQSGQTLSIAHGGNGTLMHLTAEMFNRMAGTSIGLVPYRGTAPVVNDLLGGHIALGIVDPPPSIAPIEANRIAAIAISSATRFPLMPSIPTFAEQGLTGFESAGWFGIVAPGSTPADVIAKLNAAFTKTLKDPAVIKQIRALGSEPMPMTPAEFSAFMDKEISKWSGIVSALAQKPN
jgi:tripartite-type tricarboxylate transporter receptor subunit TctC